jgi:hypothetical protein
MKIMEFQINYVTNSVTAKQVIILEITNEFLDSSPKDGSQTNPRFAARAFECYDYTLLTRIHFVIRAFVGTSLAKGR